MVLRAMMEFCSFLLLLISFITGSKSVNPSVTVKFNDSAVLHCFGRCSGLVRWTVFSKPDDILAECDQTSCRSVKDGYQMDHHQYQNGDFSLTITEADFTKRNWYISNCDSADLCDVALKIQPLITSQQVKINDTLELNLDIPDDVEVLYKSRDTAGRSSVQICTVNGRSVQCKPEYEQRTSVTSVLKLRGVNISDSGDYIIKDKRNNETIHTYRVTVGDLSSGDDGNKTKPSPSSPSVSERGRVETGVPRWVFPVVGVLVVALVMSALGNLWQSRRNLWQWTRNLWQWTRNQSPKSGSEPKGSHQNTHAAENLSLTKNGAAEIC